MKLLLTVATAALMAAATPALAQTYELNVSMVQSGEDPMMVGLEHVKARVEERTNGDLTINIFPSSQLGDTKDVMEQALAGANSAANTDAAYLAEYVPEIGIFGAPYVFDNYQQAAEFSETELFAGWTGQMRAESGLVVLSFNWYQGARHLLTKVEVNEPADLAGMRIRAPQAPVWTETVAGMGGTPTPLAWGELYPALQSGVVDGAEAHIAGIYGSRLHEVVPFVELTGHIELITAFVAGDTWFSALPEEYQAILFEEFRAGGAVASDALIAAEAEIRSKIESETGTKFVEVDRSLFSDAIAEHGAYEKVGLQDTYTAVRGAVANQ